MNEDKDKQKEKKDDDDSAILICLRAIGPPLIPGSMVRECSRCRQGVYVTASGLSQTIGLKTVHLVCEDCLTNRERAGGFQMPNGWVRAETEKKIGRKLSDKEITDMLAKFKARKPFTSNS